MGAQRIGRYEIIKELGRGGMATVVLARDSSINRQVAIKILPRQFTHDPQFRMRFDREVQVIAALEHACIVPVYDYGQEGDQPYIIMRYMPGGTLRQRLTGQPMSLAQTVPMAQRVAEALDAAHKRGILHRDLKPSNILFDADGHAFLTDFGIAKLAQEASTLTGTGMMIGTPEYMSPEQAMGLKALDGQSDVYSFAVILYEMMSGRHPYEAETPVGLMLKHVTDPVPHLETAPLKLPPECNEILTRALAKKPDERYPTAGALVGDLNVLLASTAPTRLAAAVTPPKPSAPALKPAQPSPPSPPAPTQVSQQAHKRLSEIPCSNCHGAGLELQLDGGAVCKYCGTPNAITGTLCPRCERVNASGVEHCENCGEPLIRFCPSCQAKNWGGVENCAECGQPMDILSFLTERWGQDTAERLSVQQREAKSLKQEEEAASERRRAYFEDIERRRLQALAEAKRRSAKERQIMLAVFIGLLVVGALIAVIVVLTFFSS